MNRSLDIKLEEAFFGLQGNIDNALIISHLQSEDKEVNIYLIAKQPREDVYFGILETEFIDKKQIAGIPLVNIEALDVREVFMTPFWSKPYIEQNLKKFNNMNLEGIFNEDKEFREKIIFLHYAKSENYIAAKKDDLLFALGFSKGLDSIPICVSTTQSVKSYSMNAAGEIIYDYNSGFLGLPTYLNIVNLFPLLSQYCFGAKDCVEILRKMKESKNGQLLAFGDSLMRRASPDKLDELVNILNMPESNPEIENLEKSPNKDILVLNQRAYDKFYKKLITEEVLAPYINK